LFAQASADFIAAETRASVMTRGTFILALSGGRTPGPVLRALTRKELPWHQIQIVQVDERVAPAGHADRNLTGLQEDFLRHVSLRAEQVHTMPVDAPNLLVATSLYTSTLQTLAGTPPILDLVQLGLGADGHTASLVPGDPVLDVNDIDVALSGIYQGRRRMTLTYSAINRARKILWLVTGRETAEMLARMLRGDGGIPAGRIRQEQAYVFADSEAARLLNPSTIAHD
jgi:6-phosphogluconolactonase